MRASLEQARVELAERLRERRAEIEEALLARTYAIADPAEAADPEYAEGLRLAVSAALDYGLTALERGEDRAPPVPSTLLAQARLAARSRVSLDTVLRRYFAGYTVLGDFLVQEVEADTDLRGTQLKHLLRTQATIFDRLVVAVSEEHGREAEVRPDTAEDRRAKRIERLLAGELVETAELAYDFEGFHLGAVASGPGAAQALRELARSLDQRLLLLRPGEDTTYAWLGARRPLDVERLQSLFFDTWPEQIVLAVGECLGGMGGWRLTHQQARAALPIALHRRQRFVRYGSVAVHASVHQDDLLAASLRQLYLEPIEQSRDGGTLLMETLRAYFAAGRNVSSAAAALGTSRQTVGSRLRVIEERLGRTLDSCAMELELALRLQEGGA